MIDFTDSSMWFRCSTNRSEIHAHFLTDILVGEFLHATSAHVEAHVETLIDSFPRRTRLLAWWDLRSRGSTNTSAASVHLNEEWLKLKCKLTLSYVPNGQSFGWYGNNERWSSLLYLICEGKIAIKGVSAIDGLDLFSKERFIFGIFPHAFQPLEQFHAVLARILALTRRVTVLENVRCPILHLPHRVAITVPKEEL